jgi:hypothetical protein
MRCSVEMDNSSLTANAIDQEAAELPQRSRTSSRKRSPFNPRYLTPVGDPKRSPLSCSEFSLGFEVCLLYSLLMPNDPIEGGVLLEDWCDLMRTELKIVWKDLAELRRDSGNEKHWLYVRSCLEECSSSLDIISGIIPKNTVLLTFGPSNGAVKYAVPFSPKVP